MASREGSAAAGANDDPPQDIWSKSGKDYSNTVKGTHERLDELTTGIIRELEERDGALDRLDSKMSGIQTRLDQLLDRLGVPAEPEERRPASPVQSSRLASNPPPPSPRPRRDSLPRRQQRPYLPEEHGPPPLPFTQRPTNVTDAERLPDGKLNLQRVHQGGLTNSDQEERVRMIWPEAILPFEATSFGRCEEKNKVILPPHLKLVWADHTVMDKLSEIQNRLKIALVPYELWANRVSTEIAGDFQQVAIYLRSWRPSWVTFLEAIFQVLSEHHVLFSPITSFATLLPYQDESMINFMRRLRETFYRLPHRNRNSYQDREILINILRTHTPSVWLSLHDHIAPWNTAQIVEEAVRRAGLITTTAIESKIYSTPATTFQLQGTSAPFYNVNVSEATPAKPGKAQIEPLDATRTVPKAMMISDPQSDDRRVAAADDEGYAAGAAKATDNKCFNCGKKGHWAKDCRQRPPRQDRRSLDKHGKSKGDKVTLKGTLFKDDQKARFGNRVKNSFRKWKDNARFNAEAAQNDKDDEIERSPSETLAAESDPDLDEELEELFDDMMQE